MNHSRLLMHFICLHVPKRFIVCLNIQLDDDRLVYQITEHQWERHIIDEVYKKFSVYWLKIHHAEFDMTPERHKRLVMVQNRLDKAQEKRDRKNAKRLKNRGQ